VLRFAHLEPEELNRGEVSMGVKVVMDNGAYRLDWPEGQTLPNVGDEVHFVGKEPTLTVTKRRFEFNNGRLVTVRLYF
jgi:hypothetical protein